MIRRGCCNGCLRLASVDLIPIRLRIWKPPRPSARHYKAQFAPVGKARKMVKMIYIDWMGASFSTSVIVVSAMAVVYLAASGSAIAQQTAADYDRIVQSGTCPAGAAAG